MHVHHVAALGVALQESVIYGQAYATQVIRNAQALAAELYARGVKAMFPHKGFTQTHQVLVELHQDQAEAIGCWRQLENSGIHCNLIDLPFKKGYGLRLGTSEATRRGMNTDEMIILAGLIAAGLNKEIPADLIRSRIRELSSSVTELEFV
ncbi:MAG: hypothetical protein R2864_05520 [Syntrophotaleaceae bacterium]